MDRPAPTDRLPIRDVERHHLHLAAVAILEPVCELVIVNHPGELENQLIADGDTGDEHAFDLTVLAKWCELYSALRPRGVFVLDLETDTVKVDKSTLICLGAD